MTELALTSDPTTLIVPEDNGGTLVTLGTPAVGPQGIGGPPGSNGASPVYTGPWNSASGYTPLDMVLYDATLGGDGCGYICIVANSNEAPGSGSIYWGCIAQRGQAGETGAAGDAGSGTVLFPWKGVWSSSHGTYHQGEVVRYNDSSSDDYNKLYICLNTHTSSSSTSPPADSSDWQEYQPAPVKGSNGSPGINGTNSTAPGPTGPRGGDGPQGPPGGTGSQGPAAMSDVTMEWNNTDGTHSWPAPQACTVSGSTNYGSAASGATVVLSKNGSPQSGSSFSLASGDILSVQATGVAGNGLLLVSVQLS